MLKIELNNKEFDCEFVDLKLIKINHFNKSDLLFFNDWFNNCKGIKSKYIKNIKFKQILNNGTMHNCFPIIDRNENVYISFDYF
jgi:hypothetical protein